MPYKAAKISFDGSHYIATPKENFPQGHKRRRAAIPSTPKEVEQKAQFEAAYKESQKLPRKERKACMQKAMEKRARVVRKFNWSRGSMTKRAPVRLLGKSKELETHATAGMYVCPVVCKA